MGVTSSNLVTRQVTKYFLSSSCAKRGPGSDGGAGVSSLWDACLQGWFDKSHPLIPKPCAVSMCLIFWKMVADWETRPLF